MTSLRVCLHLMLAAALISEATRPTMRSLFDFARSVRVTREVLGRLSSASHDSHMRASSLRKMFVADLEALAAVGDCVRVVGRWGIAALALAREKGSNWIQFINPTILRHLGLSNLIAGPSYWSTP